MKAPAVAADCVPAIVRRVADAPDAPEQDPPIGWPLAETALPWLAGVAGPSVLGSEAQGHPARQSQARGGQWACGRIDPHRRPPARTSSPRASYCPRSWDRPSRARLPTPPRGGRPVRQFNPFFVRQDAVSEVEMEEIKRHMTLLDNPPRLNPAVRSVWHPEGICLLEPRHWNRQNS